MTKTRSFGAAVSKSAMHCPESDRYADLSVRKSWISDSVDISSMDAARSMLIKRTPLRHAPLVALLRSALRHRVLIIADGEDWRRTHDAVLPHFSSSVVGQTYAPVVRAVAGECFDELLAKVLSGEHPEVPRSEIDVEPLMRTITLSVMCHVLFGDRLPLPQAKQIEALLSEATRAFDHGPSARINRWIGFVFLSMRMGRWQPVVMPRAQRRALNQLLDWIQSQINGTEPTGDRTSLLDSLRARYASLGEQKARTCVTAECAMFFIAGIETTAAALTFAIADIASHPEVQTNVSKEARSEIDSEHSASPQSRFPFLHQVVRETLRRHTIVPTMIREAEADYVVLTSRPAEDARTQVAIRRGSILRYVPLLDHMGRSIWGDPHQYRPERFADSLTAGQKKHYHPFGIGPQACPGRSMATMECILILQAFFERFDVEACVRRVIPIVRNAVYTNRPVGVTVRIGRAAATGGTHQERNFEPDTACRRKTSDV